jgi:hypothetical protein
VRWLLDMEVAKKLTTQVMSLMLGYSCVFSVVLE